MLTDSVETAQDDWQSVQESNLRKILKIAAESIILDQPDNKEVQNVLKSTTERQLEYGLSKSLYFPLCDLFEMHLFYFFEGQKQIEISE